jgi:hypothetical protein
MLALLTNGEKVMSIKISSTQEFSEEQINDISNILMDNIVIINT